MPGEATFPVLWQGKFTYLIRLQELGCPRSVPWAFIEPHREWCLKNHSQTPEQLFPRGGLAPSELLAVIEHRRFRSMTPEDEVGQLQAALKKWEDP